MIKYSQAYNISKALLHQDAFKTLSDKCLKEKETQMWR